TLPGCVEMTDDRWLSKLPRSDRAGDLPLATGDGPEMERRLELGVRPKSTDWFVDLLFSPGRLPNTPLTLPTNDLPPSTAPLGAVVSTSSMFLPTVSQANDLELPCVCPWDFSKNRFMPSLSASDAYQHASRKYLSSSPRRDSRVWI